MKFEYTEKKFKRDPVTTEEKKAICRAWLAGTKPKQIAEDFALRQVNHVYKILKEMDGKDV